MLEDLIPGYQVSIGGRLLSIVVWVEMLRDKWQLHDFRQEDYDFWTAKIVRDTITADMRTPGDY